MAQRKRAKPTRHRPGKDSEGVRRHRVCGIVSEQERDMIRQAAECYDMSVSEYVRSCAMATAHHIMPEIEALESAVVELAYASEPAEA